MAELTAASANQKRFVGDLVRDLERLFFAGKPKAEAADYFAWLGGICKKNASTLRDVFLTKQEDVEELIEGLTSYQAWRLIGALQNIRDRMDAKLPRDKVKTPKQILAAIWKAVNLQGMDKEMVQEIVFAVTEEETSSTGNLRRDEAIKVLRRVGGSTRVFEMTPPKKEGGRPGFRSKEETRI